MLKKKVFVVEGANFEGKKLGDSLERLGYQVVRSSKSGSDLVKEFTEVKPDVLVAEFNPPEGSCIHEKIGPVCVESDVPTVYIFEPEGETAVGELDRRVCCKLYRPWTDIELKHRIDSAIYRGNVERQLREKEERFRLFYENSPIAYQSLDAEGRILNVNPAWCEMLGYDRSEVVGRDIAEFMLPSYRDKFATTFEEYKKSGSVRAAQTCMLRADGSEIYVEGDGNIGRDENGEFMQTHCVLRNVTDRKLAEAERERYHRMLETKNKELEQIIHIASHDLRSPLVTIRGFGMELANACERICELLADPEPGEQGGAELDSLLQEDVPESLGFITAGADKMESLINSLLRLARLGTAAVKIEPLDMNQLVDKIQQSLGFQIQEKDVEIRVGELPGCEGDSVQISQLFSNLVGNAIKYLLPSRRGLVQVSGRVVGDRVEYCVEDNGCGVEPDQLERIFEIFYRLDPDGTEGEGLGLAIVKRIVNGHGGEIRAESEPGKGSRFYVCLPAVKN